jgi:hypothetical protein
MSAYESNMRQLMNMTNKDRNVLAIKLKSELQEFKDRERVYIEKRLELQELEKKYRKKQDS